MSTYSLIINPEIQSSAIQKWIDLYNPPQGYPIEVQQYRSDDLRTLYKLMFSPACWVRFISLTVSPMMLEGNFGWSPEKIEHEMKEGVRLVEIRMPGWGSCYYAQTLDVDTSLISFDFFIAEGRSYGD
jgi:hypothetical protein